MNTRIRTGSIMLLATLIISSCDSRKQPQAPAADHKTAMMEADRAFSKMSQEKGVKDALLHYIDDKGVLLRPNTIPLVGGNAVDYISQGNDTSYIMTWEPSGGSVATSGDLGYTYGVYSLKPKSKDTVYYGTYVSIWKKQQDSSWKFVLETGNEGIQ